MSVIGPKKKLQQVPFSLLLHNKEQALLKIQKEQDKILMQKFATFADEILSSPIEKHEKMIADFSASLPRIMERVSLDSFLLFPEFRKYNHHVGDSTYPLTIENFDLLLTILIKILHDKKTTTLDLTNNQIGDHIMMVLSPKLKQLGLTHLILSWNTLRAASLSELANNLPSSLIHLNLSNNYISHNGISFFIKGLADSKHPLKSLNMNYNIMGKSEMITRPGMPFADQCVTVSILKPEWARKVAQNLSKTYLEEFYFAHQGQDHPAEVISIFQEAIDDIERQQDEAYLLGKNFTQAFDDSCTIADIQHLILGYAADRFSELTLAGFEASRTPVKPEFSSLPKLEQLRLEQPVSRKRIKRKNKL